MLLLSHHQAHETRERTKIMSLGLEQLIVTAARALDGARLVVGRGQERAYSGAKPLYPDFGL